MQCATLRRLAASVALTGSLAGCYRLVFKQEDEANLRRQFRLPDDVAIISLESSPKKAGFFGREGLRISAIFQFDDRRFGDYLLKIEDKGAWRPVAFVGYSPSIADEYSKDALQWRDLPVPADVIERAKRVEPHGQIFSVARGKYYCSAIIAERGARIEHRGGGYHYEWRNLGRSCSELPDLGGATIFTFGILDMGARRLYAQVAFSG